MKLFILAMAVCIVFISCDKDSSDNNGPTKTELITKASWKFEDAGADATKDGSIDISFASQLPTCLTDNTLTLSAGGSGTVDEGTSKCDPSIPQSTAVTWSFANNESFLNLGGGGLLGITGQFKIVTLTDASLALSKDTTLQGLQSSFIIKLKH
ncbi:MAG TPA: hypothetical protein VFS22_09855 [Flavisolibacter sp.]|nr:hypothetical protein [Flavisolibacter sp.]